MGIRLWRMWSARYSLDVRVQDSAWSMVRPAAPAARALLRCAPGLTGLCARIQTTWGVCHVCPSGCRYNGTEISNSDSHERPPPRLRWAGTASDATAPFPSIFSTGFSCSILAGPGRRQISDRVTKTARRPTRTPGRGLQQGECGARPCAYAQPGLRVSVVAPGWHYAAALVWPSTNDPALVIIRNGRASERAPGLWVAFE